MERKTEGNRNGKRNKNRRGNREQRTDTGCKFEGWSETFRYFHQKTDSRKEKIYSKMEKSKEIGVCFRLSDPVFNG